MTNRLRALWLASMVAALSAFGAVAAFATTTPQHVTDVNTAVGGARDDVVSVISTNLPIILTVTVAFLMIPIGKRLVRFLKG